MIRFAASPDGDGGFATPVVALMLAVLVLALGGVSIDLWRVISAHAQLSGAVDAAAIAGAGAVDVDSVYLVEAEPPVLDAEEASRRVCAYLESSLEGIACPGPTIEIRVEGANVTVQARASVETTLLRLLLAVGGGSTEIELGAQATAQVFRREPIPIPR